MEDRAPVNFRTFLVVALAVVGSVLCAYLYIFCHVAGLTVGIIYLSALTVTAIILTVLALRKKCKTKYPIAFIIAFILSVVSFCIATTYTAEREKEMNLSGYRSVTGRVCAVDVRTGIYKIDLENLIMDGKEVSGILRVNVLAGDENYAETVNCGDVLSFDAVVSVSALTDGAAVKGSSYRSDIRYYASVRADGFSVSFGEPTAIETLLDNLYGLLVDNMGEEYGSISYSMITGDKHMLDDGVTDYYSAAGLGHIMAVSGLHVGFVVALLYLLLSRLNGKIRFAIISAVLVFYMIIADFSPSIVRAVIMTEISMSAVFLNARRDMLSSLLCAFSLILAIKPFYLFEAGFLMSFGAIFGISMFAGSIKRSIGRRGIRSKIGQAIGSSVSVQIGIAPAEIFFFGKLQIIAVAVNLVLIPFISVVFIVLLLCVLIAAIPGLGMSLLLPKYLMIPIDYIAQSVGALSFSTVAVGATSTALLCYPMMFCASEYFMMPRGKIVVIIMSAVCCVAVCAFGCMA